MSKFSFQFQFRERKMITRFFNVVFHYFESQIESTFKMLFFFSQIDIDQLSVIYNVVFNDYIEQRK